MTKFNAFVATAVAAMFVAGGAMAATTVQPAAGEAPFMHETTVSTHSTLTRAVVEGQAAQYMPASGQSNAKPVVRGASALTRSAVAGRVEAGASEMHRFPDASGTAPVWVAR